MSARFPGRLARISVACSLICTGSVIVLAGWYVGDRYKTLAARIDAVEPQYSRLAGLLTREAEFRSARTRAEHALALLAFPDDVDDGSVGSTLQQRVRQLAEEHDIVVTGSQILPPRNAEGYALIGVSVSFDGESVAIAEFLRELRMLRPPMLVERLMVQSPRGGLSGEHSGRLAGQAQLTAVRLMP